MSSNPKAEKFEKLGDKYMNKFDWFGGMKETNMETAGEHYLKAAAQYKISKDFEKSGECYEKAAKAHMAANNQIEAVGNWRESGKMYRHVDSKKAMLAYKNAITHYLSSDRFSQAAKLQEEIAEMFVEDDKLEEAIQAYEECADLFKTENDINSMNKRLLKVAHMSAKLRKYPRSITIFEKVANFNVDNNLLRWNVKTLLFKAMLCQLNHAAMQKKENNPTTEDMKEFEVVTEAYDTYKDISDIFGSSREAKLCEVLVVAIPQLDMDRFKEGIIEYDRISKLDPWCTQQLLHLEHFIDDLQRKGPDVFGGLNNESNNNNNNEEEKEEPQSPNQVNPFDNPTNTENAPNLTDAPDLL